MKRIVLLIAFIVYIFHVSAGIYTDPKSKVNYTYNSYDLKDSEATVSSSPDASGDIKLLPSFFIEDKEYQVVSISDNAFNNCSNITSVAIPEGIKTIGKGAFWDCTNMISREIPSSITSIRTYAFYGCKNIRNLYISDLTAWCKISFWDKYSNPFCIDEYYGTARDLHLYLNGTEVTDLEIPESIEAIKSYTFFRLNLNSLTIPSCVKEICSEAFSGCYINTVRYLSTSPIKGVTYSSFGGSSIENVHVTSIKWLCNNNHFTPLQGAKHLYIDGEEITNVIIPEDVKVISEYAFEGFDGIKTLKISDSVTNIGKDAFRGCYNLTSVVLGNSVTEIRSSAFSSCSNLMDPYTTGITEIKHDDRANVKNSNVWYTINGCRLPSTPTQKGIYIFNGKKIIIR